MTVRAHEIEQKFSHLLTWAKGPKDAIVTHPCSAEKPSSGAIVFIHRSQYLKTCIEAKVSMAVIPPSLATEIPDNNVTAIFTSSDIALAMALVNGAFFPVAKPNEPQIHPQASIASSATVEPGCTIGPCAVIAEHAIVGKNCIIGANAVIEAYCEIGESTHIHALAYIGHHTKVGRHCVVQSQSAIGSVGFGYAMDNNGQHHHKPHYGRVILEDRVEIGANVVIDRGSFEDSVIGEGTKIDNHCHFGHNIHIGKNCIITAGMITAGSVTIGDNCIFGGRTTINGHQHITNNVVVAALSGVSSSIDKPGKYGGWPLQTFKDSIKSIMALAHLPRMRKDISLIKKNLNLK